ncbi:MAG: DUF3011 domain-containing protein, partial [Bdellovibrionota bacterium]
KIFPKNLLIVLAAAVLLAPIAAQADGWRGGQGGGQGGGFNNGGHDDHGGRGDDRGGRGDGRGDGRGGDWGRGGHGGGWDHGGHGGGWGNGGGNGGGGQYFPPPYPVQLQTTLNCSSFNYQFNNCMINANIVSVQLVNQRSMAACVLGQSWGYQANSVWVSQGCQGDFVVYYRQ